MSIHRPPDRGQDGPGEMPDGIFGKDNRPTTVVGGTYMGNPGLHEARQGVDLRPGPVANGEATMLMRLDIHRSELIRGIEWCGERIGYPELDIKGDTFPMTWADDGHTTFSYGESRREGEPHSVWHRVGTHDVL